MGGRWKRVACAGVVAAAVGCTRHETAPSAPPGLPTSEGRTSLLPNVFGKSDKFVPRPPAAEPVATRVTRKPGEPLKPATQVAMADLDVEAAYTEGRSAVERDQLLDKARQGYQRALATEPKDKGAMVGLARLYAKAGEKDRAVASYQAALKVYPKDHELAHRLASVQVQFADWGGAAESCRLALAVDPENRTYHKTLGLCQAQLGQWDESFGTLMKVMPEAQARYFLGRVLIDLNRPDEGKQQIQQAAKLDPQHQYAAQVLADIDAGRAVPREAVQQAGFADEGK